LSPEEEAKIFAHLSPLRLARKEYLLRAGATCSHIAFVNAGLLRAYYPQANGKESTIMFAVADWWITDMPCFIKQQPAMVSIEAVQPSEVLLLSHTKLENLYREVPKLERFFRILFQNAYVREQLRTIQNLSESAEARYQAFIQKYPQILPYITQKQIASYLGITPEFLSTIRSSLAERRNS